MLLAVHQYNGKFILFSKMPFPSAIVKKSVRKNEFSHDFCHDLWSELNENEKRKASLVSEAKRMMVRIIGNVAWRAWKNNETYQNFHP